LELSYFPLGEIAEFAGRDVEVQRAESNAFDFLDQVANGLKHAVNLSIAPFDEDDFVPGVGCAFDETNFCRGKFDSTVVFERDGHTMAEFLDGLLRRPAGDFDVIGLGHVGRGFGEPLGERAVIGDKKKAFTRVVEAADRIEAFGLVAEELHDGGASLGIAGGGDVVSGLVQ